MAEQRKPVPGSESFESQGATWHLAPIGPAERDAFGSKARSMARASLARDRQDMGPAEYMEERRLLQQEIAAGSYDWGPPRELGGTGMGEGCYSVFRSAEGKIYLAGLLLRPAHGDLTEQAIVSIITGNEEGFSEAFVAALGLDPNRKAPASTQTPGTTTSASQTPTTPAEEVEIIGRMVQTMCRGGGTAGP